MYQIPKVEIVKFVTRDKFFEKPTLTCSKVTAQSTTMLSVPTKPGAVRGTRKLLSAAHSPQSMNLDDKFTSR